MWNMPDLVKVEYQQTGQSTLVNDGDVKDAGELSRTLSKLLRGYDQGEVVNIDFNDE